MKGQGATEYLVLLAVVLIIALVSIALLGFFPGLSSDAKITQSASYWKSGKPFAIIEHSIDTSGTARLVMQNMDGAGTLTVNGITLTGTSAKSNTTSVTFAPGEIKTYTMNASGVTAGTVTAGQIYDLQVSINYTTSNNINNTQFGGAKTLVGKYV